MEDKRVNLNGVLVHPFASADELMEYVDGHKGILVAINAGKIYRATEATRNLINSNIGYVDGVGALKALHKKGKKLAIRIPCCELWLDIIKRNYQSGAKFYFVGGKQEVIDDVVTQLQVDFPGINIVGYRNGYIDAQNDFLKNGKL
jgi:UDP-N-acetyl-D-mannosaminouronate:lipid I N-acetyl-D-mannosaminouronosyltransferase